MKYRLIIGLIDTEEVWIVKTKVQTLKGAYRALKRAINSYPLSSYMWGRIEEKMESSDIFYHWKRICEDCTNLENIRKAGYEI